MTETDFFRIARERMGDYSLTVSRNSTIGGHPYAVRLEFDGKSFFQHGETLPEALSSIAYRAGIDRRKQPRALHGSGDPFSDPQWPCG